MYMCFAFTPEFCLARGAELGVEAGRNVWADDAPGPWFVDVCNLLCLTADGLVLARVRFWGSPGC